MNFLTNLLGSASTEAKNLTESRAQIDAAKANAEKVAELFVVAGLDLDAFLAAGPDALKAHLESVGASDEELAVAKGKILLLEGNAEALTASLNTATQRCEFNGSLLSAIGLTVSDTTTDADAKAAFDSHVKQAAALELAKAGHAPVADVVDTGATAAKPSAIDPTLTGLARVKAAFEAQAKTRK